MKNLLLVSGCILITFFGCKLIDKLTQFDVEFNETVVIPASTGINLPLDFLTPDITTNSESTFAINDTRKDLVEEIRLKTLRLTHTSPSEGDFSFLKSVNVFISAEGLDEIKIAWKDNIPANVGKILFLDLADVDLKEFIKKDKFVLRLNTVTDELINSDQYIDVYSVFFVDAKILGQ